jgi:hypothetical protein
MSKRKTMKVLDFFKYLPNELIGNVLHRPKVLACSSLSEVLPIDVLMLRVTLAGWGWLKLEGKNGYKHVEFFKGPIYKDVVVPVFDSVCITVSNVWGSQKYWIDTSTNRHEIWKMPESEFHIPQISKNILSKSVDYSVVRFQPIKPLELTSLAMSPHLFTIKKISQELKVPLISEISIPRLLTNLNHLEIKKFPHEVNIKLPMSSLDSQIENARMTHIRQQLL